MDEATLKPMREAAMHRSFPGFHQGPGAAEARIADLTVLANLGTAFLDETLLTVEYLEQVWGFVNAPGYSYVRVLWSEMVHVGSHIMKPESLYLCVDPRPADDPSRWDWTIWQERVRHAGCEQLRCLPITTRGRLNALMLVYGQKPMPGATL